MDQTLDKVVRSPRLAARRRAVRLEHRRRRRRVALGVLLVAGLVAGGILLSRSLLFDLSSVRVVGADTVDAKEIVRASGLEIGQSVLTLDLDAIADRIERLPGIRGAVVERDGSLAITITVTERTPAVEVRTGGRRWLLDADGQPVAATLPADAIVPVLKVRRAPGVGAVVPRGATAAVLAVWDMLPDDVRAEVKHFITADDGGIEARLGRARVVFGSPERLPEKIEALRLVLVRVEQERRRLSYLDLRAPERPAARVS